MEPNDGEGLSIYEGGIARYQSIIGLIASFHYLI
jgi:hypothetical protein